MGKRAMAADALHTVLAPLIHLIGKKAGKDEIPKNVSELNNDARYIPAAAKMSIGQAMVVKSIDAKGQPTEWESVTPATNSGIYIFELPEDGIITDAEVKSRLLEFAGIMALGNDEVSIKALAEGQMVYCRDLRKSGGTLYPFTGARFVYSYNDDIESGAMNQYELRFQGICIRCANSSGDNWHVVPDQSIILRSSTAGSTKQFRITVDDSGKPTFADTDNESNAWIPDYVSTPTTAAVGQTIVVKSVNKNGKPTEWETKDIPECEMKKAYTLTETITLAEAINSKTLTFTEDADSYQLALSCPAAEAALGVSVEVYTSDGLVAYMWMAGMIDTTAKYAKCSMYRAHGEWVFESMQPVNNENQTSAVSRNPKFVSAEKPITKIVVYASGGGMMPAGTTIEVRSF